jgi:hypothetical protein
MSAMGMIYPQYWLNSKMFDATFPIHLAIIKVAFSIYKKTKVGTLFNHYWICNCLTNSFFFPTDYESQCRANNG